MNTLIDLCEKLFEITQLLHSKSLEGDLELLITLQQSRAQVINDIDKLCTQEWPEEEALEARILLEKSRTLEREIYQQLEQKRDELGKEHSQLMRNKKANKAYDQFR